MKGIKECLNWMIDNEGNKIKYLCGCMIYRWYEEGEFKISTSFDTEDAGVSTEFSDLNKWNWEIDTREINTIEEFGEFLKSTKKDGEPLSWLGEDKFKCRYRYSTQQIEEMFNVKLNILKKERGL